MSEEERKRQQKKIIFKFKLWGVFFGIIFILYFISSAFAKDDVKNNEGTNNNQNINENQNLNYSKIKNNLVNSNIDYEYRIKDYVIKGSITNKILYGTLIIGDDLYNIKYDGINIYEINDNNQIISSLLNDIKLAYLLPLNIINVLNETDNLASKTDTGYFYNYNNIVYNVIINDNKITNIVINDSDINYDLKYIIKENETLQN